MDGWMKQSKVTSVEVAKLAGVSQSAVSRVFTPGASASEKITKKVKKAADELGYRPNVLARSLITGKSKIVGFIVAYLDNQFYPESLQKLSKRLQEEGYHILIFTVDNKTDDVIRTIKELLDYQVDAIVAASVSLNNDMTQRCRDVGVPIVLYNRSQDDQNVSFVTSDNIEGGRMIAHHFADIGVQRPAYIAGWEGASTQRDRELGFLRGLEERGLEIFVRGQGAFDIEVAKAQTRKIFNASTLPDAVFVANDHMAFGVMDVLRYELGLNVPNDVCVAGYDDVAIASWDAYSLTSVRQPANRMVEATVEIVLNAIEGLNDQAVHKIIEGPLIIRGSTRRSK